MFSRQINYTHVYHKMYDCKGCRPNYIPDNQHGLFDIDGKQLLIDLSQAVQNFTLDLSDENARDGMDGLNSIMTPEESRAIF